MSNTHTSFVLPWLAAIACVCATLLLPSSASATTDREAALESAIYDSLPWADAEVDVADLRVTGDWPSGALTWDVPPLRSIGSRARFRVYGERGGDAWVSAQVSVLVPVWVVDAPIARGERVGPLASIALREARSLPSDVRFADAPIRDEVARMSLAPGDLLRAAAIEQPLVIERQQLVRLTVRRGAVTVEASGVALDSGRRGEVIRVRSTTSEHVLSAVVRSNGWVEVP